MQTSLLKREAAKLKRNWKTYVVIVSLFCFVPAAVDFLYKSYYPFDVSDANIQPFPVVDEVVEVGGLVTYKVDVTKNYPFPGVVNRYMYSEKCDIFIPITPPIESNRAVGRLQSQTTLEIPNNAKPCPYIIVIDVVYHPNSWRALPLVHYTTTEFLVTTRKAQIDALKDQADKIDDVIEEKVIDEPTPVPDEEATKGAAF